MYIPSAEPAQSAPPLLHIVRDLRGDAVGELDAPSGPAGLYPDFILQVAANLNDEYAAAPQPFYDLWELVLAHWFPHREGYTIQHQWRIPFLDDRDAADRITFAVLDHESPILLLQVSAPRDFHNVHTRAAAEALSGGHFEHVAPYCAYDHPLGAVAAMGKKWMAFKRSPRIAAHEAQALGEERIEWMDDIVSEVSYEVLDRFFSTIKEGVLADRRDHSLYSRS